MENTGRDLEVAAARLADAVASGDPADAATAFGRERGEAGIGIGPSLDDLETIHRLVTREGVPSHLTRAFADAWVDAAVGALLVRGAIDHRTGLATTDYLATRLRDLARSSEHAARSLIVADCRSRASSRFAAMLRAARVARALTESFPGAETPIGIESARVVAIVPSDEGFEANLARARILLTRMRGIESAEVHARRLPDAEDAVREFVLGL